VQQIMLRRSFQIRSPLLAKFVEEGLQGLQVLRSARGRVAMGVPGKFPAGGFQLLGPTGHVDRFEATKPGPLPRREGLRIEELLDCSIVAGVYTPVKYVRCGSPPQPVAE
jgi:hypothetical protein